MAPLGTSWTALGPLVGEGSLIWGFCVGGGGRRAVLTGVLLEVREGVPLPLLDRPTPLNATPRGWSKG